MYIDLTKMLIDMHNLFPCRPNAKLPSVSLTKMLDRERGTNVAPTPVNLPSLSVKCEAESNFGSDVTDYFADDLKQLH